MSATIPDFNNTQLAFASKSNVELTRDYVMFRLMNNQLLVNTGTKVAASMLNAGLSAPVTWGMKPTVYSVFCGGSSLQEASHKIGHLKKHGVDSILDYGVEGKETEADFERTAAEIHKAIDFAAVNDATKIVCSKFTGLIPFHILESLHKGDSLSKKEHADYMRCVDRINKICEHAAEKNVSLFVDAEESWIQKPLDELTSSLMKKYNRERPIVYNTVQLYLKDRLAFFKSAHSEAKKDGYIYAAKLVRGAYMEKERIRAEKLKYDNPVQPSKEATDRDYNSAVEYALSNINTLAVCIATHNEQSCKQAVLKMNELDIQAHHPHVTFSQLLGMSDHLSFNLSASGFRAAKYMPYGPVQDVIPYLIRRAQENASVSGQMGRELQLLTLEMRRRKLLPRFL